MGEISILRPRRSLVSIPVVEAVYCESCASGLELQRGMLRTVWQHLHLAAGRVGAAAADGAAPRFGIGSALRTHNANRIGQSGVVDPTGYAAYCNS